MKKIDEFFAFKINFRAFIGNTDYSDWNNCPPYHSVSITCTPIKDLVLQNESWLPVRNRFGKIVRIFKEAVEICKLKCTNCKSFNIYKREQMTGFVCKYFSSVINNKNGTCQFNGSKTTFMKYNPGDCMNSERQKCCHELM